MTEQATNIVTAATPNTVPEIPSAWAALGVEGGYNPSPAERLRLWVTGPHGEGKTVFSAGIPKQLILDFEKTVKSVVGARSKRVEIRGYDHYEQITDMLLNDAKNGKRYWDRVGIDTADEWIGMIINQLQKEKSVEDITEYGQQGKGYNLIQNRCWSKIRELEAAGYTWTIVGHQRIKEEVNPVTHQKITRLRPSIYPGFSRQIQGCADFELTIYSLVESMKKPDKVVKTSGGQLINQPGGFEEVPRYYLNALNTGEREGKTRGVPSMERKFELPLVGGWDLFVSKYNAAVAAAKAQYK